MLKIEMRPMINVHEAAEKIAAWLGHPENENIIFENIAECLTDTNSEIVRAYLPDCEESAVLDYDIECQKFFDMVRTATGLNWGDCFLAKLD